MYNIIISMTVCVMIVSWLYIYSYLQGQEVVAESALEVASKDGHWVVLQVSSAATSSPAP